MTPGMRTPTVEPMQRAELNKARASSMDTAPSQVNPQVTFKSGTVTVLPEMQLNQRAENTSCLLLTAHLYIVLAKKRLQVLYKLNK